MTDSVSEREKWLADQAFRERETVLKERQLALQEQEARQKQRQAAWSNPLVLAILAAALAATGNAVVAWFNGRAQLQLERAKFDGQMAIEDAKAEAGRIFEVIKTGDPDKAAQNLDFLVQAGLIVDPERRRSLAAFLARRQPGEGPSTPAPAGTVSRLSPTERQRLMGGPAVRFDAQANAFIDPDDPWYAANLVAVEIPELKGVPTAGGDAFAGTLRFHRAAAPALQAAFAELAARGLTGDILSFDGAFSPRTVAGRGSRMLSAHALGLALDLNMRWNRFDAPPAAAGSEGSLARVAPVLEKHGFLWGGRQPPYDGGHFEFADREQLAETPAGQP